MLIQISQLSKTYGVNVALNDINLQISQGKIIGLLGPNGSGKTTLIKVLMGLLKQYSGSVLINQNPLNDSSKALISYLPDKNCIPLEWSISYALKFFSDFFADFDSYKAKELASQLNLNPYAKIKTLSKGNKEKIALILSLSRQAQLYIFDEPIAGVDPIARERVFKLIMDNYNKQASVIIATHLVYDVQKILDEVIFLDRGQIKLHKPISEILTEHSNLANLEEIYKEYFRC
ncbi:ABC transporter ATP-binding protein [Helicobacter fennelliae]|uniref:ABC transporter n=2 Tax=Helicobacter fennelliae TaxID=215 RepID=T1D0Z6_9HELI|nr:ABC transporter ATP-binding protein [Helicobacter fennelliae]GAD18876.1 ABC transporter [Helicobacter fennelliae MRY12-0050]SQB98427.1 ABC transporter [Helicobacter fennelliae]STP08514.1 ABC transporter [Helicobacter fennelliae]STQ84326.1 ABC transporter [Helicobacter fennelliae]